MNKSNGTQITDEIAHIKQSVTDILITAVGSRIQRREYGSYLYQLIDRPLSQALMLQISAACIIAIKQWEPRIDIKAFKVYLQDQKFVADLSGVLKRNQQNINYQKIGLTL
ncbi:baseplate wedge subunit [Gallibacterium genomosp. 3]|uniref:Baseplate wedge subunit n=1 Tax=Gallibacterium genomosp. 3 TaxID=505345 RepID=A0A1A7PV71_9PAST|nr:GPW/gp25 family protein [Gallibacterium genomosp. 3]OBX05939.1 baseplate wedge subunit [Gallibacterium genomosp. 3]